MSEIEKRPSWDERQKEATERTKEILGDQTTEMQLRNREEVTAEAIELHELMNWFTEAFDNASTSFGDFYHTDAQVCSAARKEVKNKEPEKFARLRELEKKMSVRNAQHQQIATAAHASVIETNIKSTLLW